MQPRSNRHSPSSNIRLSASTSRQSPNSLVPPQIKQSQLPQQRQLKKHNVHSLGTDQRRSFKSNTGSSKGIPREIEDQAIFENDSFEDYDDWGVLKNLVRAQQLECEVAGFVPVRRDSGTPEFIRSTHNRVERAASPVSLGTSQNIAQGPPSVSLQSDLSDLTSNETFPTTKNMVSSSLQMQMEQVLEQLGSLHRGLDGMSHKDLKKSLGSIIVQLKDTKHRLPEDEDMPLDAFELRSPTATKPRSGSDAARKSGNALTLSTALYGGAPTYQQDTVASASYKDSIRSATARDKDKNRAGARSRSSSKTRSRSRSTNGRSSSRRSPNSPQSPSSPKNGESLDFQAHLTNVSSAFTQVVRRDKRSPSNSDAAAAAAAGVVGPVGGVEGLSGGSHLPGSPSGGNNTAMMAANLPNLSSKPSSRLHSGSPSFGAAPITTSRNNSRPDSRQGQSQGQSQSQAPVSTTSSRHGSASRSGASLDSGSYFSSGSNGNLDEGDESSSQFSSVSPAKARKEMLRRCKTPLDYSYRYRGVGLSTAAARASGVKIEPRSRRRHSVEGGGHGSEKGSRKAQTRSVDSPTQRRSPYMHEHVLRISSSYDAASVLSEALSQSQSSGSQNSGSIARFCRSQRSAFDDPSQSQTEGST